jgi:hypothetical protein
MSESKITCTELGKALRKIEQAADQAFAEIPAPEAEGPNPNGADFVTPKDGGGT